MIDGDIGGKDEKYYEHMVILIHERLDKGFGIEHILKKIEKDIDFVKHQDQHDIKQHFNELCATNRTFNAIVTSCCNEERTSGKDEVGHDQADIGIGARP